MTRRLRPALMLLCPAALVAQGVRAPAATRANVVPPANRAATIIRTDSTLVLRYGGAAILEARVSARGTTPDVRIVTDSSGGVVTQVIKWTARGSGGRISVSGKVHTSVEGLAVEPEPAEDSRPVVRHTVGAAHNARDRAVYDRRGDWLLSVDQPARTSVAADATGDSVTAFSVSAEGGEVAIRFRPRYYQKHRGLSRYEPWKYQPWRASVTGWTSWYAFFDKVTEADVKRTADVLGEVLLPFGFKYLQIDDGYQKLPIGMPDHWLDANDKFPSGLPALRRYISDRGLEPGIWTNVSFAQRDSAEAHANWFVRDRTGKPAYGNWVGYIMDGSNPATIENLVRPVYDSLASMGWTYFKLDALRHLRYEGYNSFAEYFERRALDRESVFRGFVESVRGMVGKENYLLACWGIRPELIGLVDGMRVGDDGFGYGAFAQYNSFNNVIWRNDPDHIELRQDDRYRSTTLTSLTGSVMMLTDPPEVYRTDRVEAAKRTAPVLFTRPGQVYDVDPSRSSLLNEANVQTSGSGARPFDADQRITVSLYQLDIARTFEQWTVLARTGGDEPSVALSDLGLKTATDYVGFEFWTKRPLGVVRDTLRAGAVDATFQIQVICLRERVGHPQLMATNRHVTCGGVDLVDVAWVGRTLSGTSDVVAGDAYEIFLTEPSGFGAPRVTADGASVVSSTMVDGVRTVRLLSRAGGRVQWRVRYDRPAPAPSSQNPSPMVEATRAHERLVQTAFAGVSRSFAGPAGKAIEVRVPDRARDRAGASGRDSVDLVIHFHGAAWIPEQAITALDGATAAAVVNLGTGSGAYDRAFSDPAVFDSLLAGIAREIAAATGRTTRIGRVTLVGFSAGHGAVRAILREPRHFARVSTVLLLDGMHTSYVPEGRVLADSGMIDTTNLIAFGDFARAAMRGEKRFVVTHSEIFPGTFASTTETADWLLRALGLRRTAALQWGPRGMQQLSEVRSGGFELLGFAGNSAPDHIDQFHAMPELLARALARAR